MAVLTNIEDTLVKLMGKPGSDSLLNPSLDETLNLDLGENQPIDMLVLAE